ncbi:MAG TPA: iron-containing alcohol dehydrogenase [Candidatus Sulfotelmatobacter sp.]|jgi:alcohol dehydrogenase YqhD (iron-dependent ADH family)|nr:iron-containing alcohol dehydrogenase [Candidatus Sulfotelmatobacter sp.]
MKWYHGCNPAQFECFAKNIFGAATAEQGIAALEAWFDKIGTPIRLLQLGITQADLPATLENVLGNASYFGVAGLYTRDVVATILNSAL